MGEAKRLAFETEKVGEGVLSDLSQQRETILHVRGSMQTVGKELTSARQSLDRMLRFAQRNRLITLAIIAFFSWGLAVWGIMFLHLSDKTTIILAACLVVVVLGILAW